MGHGYCLQGPLRVGSAQEETVASLGAIWNSWSHYKTAPQVYGSPFLLTMCGEACLGQAPLDSLWGCAPGQALTHALMVEA